MSVKLLTEHHLEFLSLKGGCKGLSESTHVKMPHCWKSHVTADIRNSIHIHMTFSLPVYLNVFDDLQRSEGPSSPLYCSSTGCPFT